MMMGGTSTCTSRTIIGDSQTDEQTCFRLNGAGRGKFSRIGKKVDRLRNLIFWLSFIVTNYAFMISVQIVITYNLFNRKFKKKHV